MSSCFTSGLSTGWCCCGCVLAPPFQSSFRYSKCTLPALAATPCRLNESGLLSFMWFTRLSYIDGTNDLVKGIHEVKDNQPLYYSVHTNNSTILFLKEAHSILSNYQKPTGSPQTMPQNDVDEIPHHNHTTHFLRGWSKSTSTHSHTQPNSLLHLTGGPLPGKVMPRKGATSIGPVSNAQARQLQSLA